MLHFIYLHYSGSSRKVAQANKLGTARNPFAVKDGVVQALLDVDDDLRLRQGRRHLGQFGK